MTLQASHSMGADLTYTCTGNGQYQVVLNFFRDCGGIDPFTSYTVSYSSATCGVSGSITVSQVGSATDITPICATAQSNCNGGGGSFGVEQWTYQGTLTLPPGCGNDWVLGWTECCRNAAITTLNGPGSQNIYVSANLDNTQVPCNNSPVFNNPPTPVVCANQPVNYSHGVSDPDGDSLVFSLVNCRQGPATNVNYAGGFNGGNPIAATPAATINPQTGAITFTPTSPQIAVMCVLVEEYRNGVKIGETVRDMQFRVVTCNNQPPAVTGINGTNVFQTTICVGANLCFDVFGSDGDGDDINLTWNNGIPTGQMVFTNNGTTSPMGTFCWTPTLADVGTNFFTVTATDDACLVSGVSTFTYQIDVIGTGNTVNAGLDQSICQGGSVVLNATSTGATSYTWSPATGLSCTNCQNPTASPSVTTVYTVTASFPDGCNLTDDVIVTVNPLPAVTVNPPVAYICPGASATLTATSPTATGFLWSTGATTNTIAVSPLVSTDYWVQVTDANGCVNRDTVTVNVNEPDTTSCNVIYASPTGTGTGTQASPASLNNAINMASCNNTIIKMAIGTYTINNAITNIAGYVTLEGGFDPANNWRKTSQAGATTIFRSTANPEGAANQQRLVAIYLNGATNVRFQDVTVSTANANLNGESTYGLHLTSCSDYTFTRTQVLPGTARAGANGTAGVAGANGSPGAAGIRGWCDDECDAGEGGNGGDGGGVGAGFGGLGGQSPGCQAQGQNGQNGTDSQNLRAGGGGGGGAAGGEEDEAGGNGGQGGGVNFGANQVGGGVGGGGGDPGGDGSNGSNGLAGTIGGTGALGSLGSHSGCFWIPGGVGGTGVNGTGGRGGVGGGGGGGQWCTFCNDGGGNGAGGGGGGGQGGTGGTGGRGGGSSYGIYLCSNLANGIIDDSRIVAGAAGAGGTGGLGGNGGTGGARGLGNTVCSSEIGEGGDGGLGGNGGRGGNGGAGRAGQSINVHLQSGVALALSDIAFNLPAQPIIFMENISCTNTDIDFSTAASVTWNLGACAAPLTPTGATVTTQYSCVGRKNIVRGADVYTGFANIILNDNTIPVAETDAPLLMGQYHVCAGASVNFWSGNPGANYIYYWNMGGGATPNTYVGPNFETVNGVVFPTPGTYYVTLQYETDCCGLSPVDSIEIIVDPQPNVAIVGPNAFCAGDSVGVQLVASGADSYVWTPATGLDVTTGPVVNAYPGTTTTYTVTGTNATGNCTDLNTYTVTVNDISLTPSVAAASCGNNGSASVIVTGGSGNYSYNWPLLMQTTQTVNNVFGGNYTVIVTDNITGCMDSVVVTVPTAPTSPAPFISNITMPPCNGGLGTATVNVVNGLAPYNYQWTTVPGGVPVGGNGATTTPLPAGTYAIIVTDGNLCLGSTTFTIPEPNPLSLNLVSTDSANCPTGDGQATVNAFGGTGPYTYDWGVGTGATQTGLNAGNYMVTVTDANGCQDSVPVNIPCVLPVEYNFLTANPFNGDIKLDWETLSEINNDRFEVLRGTDGTSFVKIGEVAAKAPQGGGAIYEFIDTDVQPMVTYHYRLQQFDVDGESDYSNVVYAMVSDLAGYTITKVYPNPFEDRVTVELQVANAGEATIRVSNVMGQDMGYEKVVNLSAGENAVELDLSDLSMGVYFGKIYIGGVQAAGVKFVKSK